MKHKRSSAAKKTCGTITKTISLPEDLATEATAKRVDIEPDLDWSKYVRRLVRKDLEAQPA